jgi:hypothetical protein
MISNHHEMKPYFSNDNTIRKMIFDEAKNDFVSQGLRVLLNDTIRRLPLE